MSCVLASPSRVISTSSEDWATVASCDCSKPAQQKKRSRRQRTQYNYKQWWREMVYFSPNSSPHRCSTTLESVESTEKKLCSEELHACAVELRSAWNSPRIFLMWMFSSPFEWFSSLSVAHAMHSFGKEYPVTHHTALWCACLAVSRGQLTASSIFYHMWAIASKSDTFPRVLISRIMTLCLKIA